jgi:glutathione S-transferase
VNTLLSIGPSPYVEKARWALTHHGIPFREEPHVPMLHWRTTRPHGRRTVPLLLADDGETLGESSDIVAWADARRPDAPPLLPERLRERVAWLDDKVGKHARRVAYDAMLPSPELTRGLFNGSPAWEFAALRVGWPLWKRAIVRGLDVTPARAAASRARLRELFDEVGGWLSDGRTWLDGDRFTALDLTFAALSAIVLLPREHGWPLPDDDALRAHLPGADAVCAFRDELLRTPAGQLAFRAYSEARWPVR